MSPPKAGVITVGEKGEVIEVYVSPWYRESPFFRASRRAGARGYQIYNHTYLPDRYGDVEEEYWHLLKHATLWDVAVERQVEIIGPDAFEFANYLTPRDLSKCAVGECKYVVITDQTGGIINDPILLRLGKDHFWLSLSDSDVLLWARGIASQLDLDVEVREPDVSPCQIQGPKAKQVVKALFGPKVLDIPYYHCMAAKLDGIPVVISRTGWSGEVGYEIYLRDGTK
jgi:aminomethyltransferase